MPILERLSDAHGAVIFGWIDDNVLYARFERTVSAELGARFARRFASILGDAVDVRYFSDSSGAQSYDLVAYRRIVEVMGEKSAQFASMVLRPWEGKLGTRAQSLPAAFEALEYVLSATEFEARLRAAAPQAKLHHFITLVESRSAAPPDRTSPTPSVAELAAPRPAEPAPEGAVLTYVFDLSDFERGQFTAVRVEHLSSRPGGAWVCTARDDQQALVLAQRAALVEWALPRTRRPEHFTVRFLHPPPEPPLDRPHEQ